MLTVKPVSSSDLYATMLTQRQWDIQQASNRIIYELDGNAPAFLHPEFRVAIMQQQLSDLKFALADPDTINQYAAFLTQSGNRLHRIKLGSQTRQRIEYSLRTADLVNAINQLQLSEQATAAQTQKNHASKLYLLGYYHRLNFDYVEAFQYFQKAANLAPDNFQYQTALQEISLKLSLALDTIEAYTRELSNARDADEVAMVATIYLQTGRYWHTHGQYSKALAYFKRSLNLQTQTFGILQPRYADTLLDMSLTFIKQNNLPLAVEMAKKAKRIMNAGKQKDAAVVEKTTALY